MRTFKAPVRTLDAEAIDKQMDAMTSEIQTMLERLDEAGSDLFIETLDVGYIGQSYRVTIPLEAVLTEIRSLKHLHVFIAKIWLFLRRCAS